MSIIERVLDRMERSRPHKAGSAMLHGKQTYDNDETYLHELQDDDADIDHRYKSKARTKADEGKISKVVDINYRYLEKLGMLVAKNKNLMLSEQYRKIKRQILNNAFDAGEKKIKNSNLVLVTSAVPEEGKSFTSLNLAFSVTSEFNNTALFIDADLPKHSSTNRLGLSGEDGLTDYLLNDDLTISDVLLRTDIPNLSIITAGKNEDWTPEILASKKMLNFLNEISHRYQDRLVIIDAPPLLQDSTASVLSRIAGQIVVVIEAEKTPQHVVQEAIDSLKDAQYVGLVLNKSNQRDQSKYSYYGYVNL